VNVRVGHLYADYLNIYADRGNLAVLVRRAAARGYDLEIADISVGDDMPPAAYDLLYIGGGQDREQALVARDLAAKRELVLSAAGAGAAVLAVCGGYQLLGRFYRFGDGEELPGVGLFPLHTIAAE
jgi:CobQ-like glutamine amidotransferase family enzyme